MKLPPFSSFRPATAVDADTDMGSGMGADAFDDDAPFRLPAAMARRVDRAGRTLAVLLTVEDPPADHIRVALDTFGAVAGTGFVSGTVH
jgi:hypothetical protein